MNALLCIGCSLYEDDALSELPGAEKDARAMFGALAGNNGLYSQERSILQLSPKTTDILSGISQCLGSQGAVDIFTFFFAGHGEAKAGTFYLCSNDTRVESLSTSAFPLSKLFEIINEFHPRQVNLIVDACDAGSSSANIRVLLRPEDIGTIGGVSVSFLGACAARQSAAEDQQGGVLTIEILKVLRGDVDLQLREPLIDLSEIASYVSAQVLATVPDQYPIWWGLSLFGRGGFARNPRFNLRDPLPGFSVASIDPLSAAGKLLSTFSARLWEEYRLARTNFDADRLNHLLSELFSHESLTVNDRVTVIAGLSATVSRHAACHNELLTEHFCVATFLVSLLPWAEETCVRNFVRQQIVVEFEKNTRLQESLTASIKENSSVMRSPVGFLADLYFLPLRITKLLGWVGATAIIGELFGCATEQTRAKHRDFVATLISTYPRLLVAFSDEQAPGIYIFLKAALKCEWNDAALDVVQLLYMDASAMKGRINRVNSSGEESLDHILHIIDSPFASKKRQPANPTFLLPIILLGGVWTGCAEDWELEDLDRRNLGFFMPDDYHEFGKRTMDNGQTYTNQIGFGLWFPEELEVKFKLAEKAHRRDVLSSETHALCMLSSMLFPDRVPFNLEQLEMVSSIPATKTTQ